MYVNSVNIVNPTSHTYYCFKSQCLLKFTQVLTPHIYPFFPKTLDLPLNFMWQNLMSTKMSAFLYRNVKSLGCFNSDQPLLSRMSSLAN